MQNSDKFSKNIRRKKVGSEEEEEKPHEEDKIRRKRKDEKVRKHNIIAGDFHCVDIAE